MEIRSLALLCAPPSSSQDWQDRRERRSGYRRRVEDEAALPDVVPAGPSIGFLAQVVSQIAPERGAPAARAYAPAFRFRCGVCADERA